MGLNGWGLPPVQTAVQGLLGFLAAAELTAFSAVRSAVGAEKADVKAGLTDAHLHIHHGAALEAGGLNIVDALSGQSHGASPPLKKEKPSAGAGKWLPRLPWNLFESADSTGNLPNNALVRKAVIPLIKHRNDNVLMDRDAHQLEGLNQRLGQMDVFR